MQDNPPSENHAPSGGTGADDPVDTAFAQHDDQKRAEQQSIEPPKPTKVVRREKVNTPQSFIDFVRYYGTIETITFLDVKNGKAFSILNYAAKRVIRQDDEDDIENGDDEGAFPAYYEAPPPSFHCNWQLVYELSHTPEWLQLEELTFHTYSEREGALKLLQLKDYFIEPDEEFEASLSFRETDLRTFLPQVLDVDASPATDDEMVKLMLDKKDRQDNLLINFAIAVHAGCIVLDALILVERTDGKITFNIINREQIVLASMKSGIAKIRTNLGDTFPVFDTDLNDHADLTG